MLLPVARIETLPFERMDSAARLVELTPPGVSLSHANFGFFTLTVP